MSDRNGRWVQFTWATLLLGGMLWLPIGIVGGVWWNKDELRILSDGLRALEGRLSLQRADLNKNTDTLNAEIARERNEDSIMARDISDAQRNVAALQQALPLKLPTIHEIIEQHDHILAQDGRLDDMARRISALCGQLAGISAASAKKAGC